VRPESPPPPPLDPDDEPPLELEPPPELPPDELLEELLDAGINAGQHEGGGKSLEMRRFGFNLDHGGVSGGLKVLVDLSTTGPSVAAVCAKAAAAKNVAWLDSPVSGGITGATKGTLAVMVSGPKATYDGLEDVLKVFGKLFYVGEKPGLAQVAKLGNNLLAAAAIVLSSEAVVMGVKAGIDPKVLIDIINAGSGRNSATQDKFPRAVLTRTFDFGFATGLSYKDVRLCLDEAEALGVPMVAGAAVRQMLAITQAKFGFDSDFTSIAKVVEEWAGVEIKG